MAFLVCLGAGEGRALLDEGGGLFSLAGLDEGSTLACTGWFFFPDGTSVGPSAGRFIPPIPPTVCTPADTQTHEDSGTGAERDRDRDTHSESVHGSSCSTARRMSGY